MKFITVYIVFYFYVELIPFQCISTILKTDKLIAVRSERLSIDMKLTNHKYSLAL
jgi:hypothetical protein